MNREQRRRLDRGKKKTATLAGVSLAAASGLFGAYLGNGRIPKAYAAVTCNTTGTYNVANQSDWSAAVSSINAGASKDCFVINITSDFTVSADLVNTAKINLASQLTPKKVTIVGNDKVVTGAPAPGVPIASFMFIRMPDGVVSEVHISDLTITGMHMDTSYRSAVAQIYAQKRGSAYGFVNTYWDDVHLINNTSGNGWNSLVNQNGEFHISNSTFIGNSVTSPASYVTGGLFHVFANKNAPAHHSTITDSVFRDNAAVSGGSGSYYASGGAVWNQVSSGSSLTIENSTFDGNSATATLASNVYGGAVQTNVPLIVRESVFTENTVTGPTNVGGGAIAVNARPFTSWGSSGAFGGAKVYDSLFSGNEAIQTGVSGSTVNGGAISVYDSPLAMSIENSTFYGNAAQASDATANGGAVSFDDNIAGTAMTIVNSTFSGNLATSTGSYGYGGAVYTTAPLSVDFATITGNASAYGGGTYATPGNTITITNSIVNANTAPEGGADIKGAGGTISDHSLFTSTGSVSGTFTYGPDTLFSASAQVGAVADNGGTVIGATSDDTVIPTMLPLPGALVLDAGTVTPVSGVLPATDERGTGFPRVVGGLTSMGAVQPSAAPPSPPAPAFPPSAPRDVVGVPGDREVAVSWQPPTDSGSFPVTNYLVTAGPGGKTCLAKAPALTCTVTGLTNGVAYTFVVKALNGAGWGADGGPSAPVTPSAKARSLTLFQGKRAADGRHDRITTGGTSVGVPAGSRLTPWIRYGDTGAFVEGVASIVVGSDGEFTWTRQIRKDRKFTAYVAYEDLESNRVIWQRVR